VSSYRRVSALPTLGTLASVRRFPNDGPRAREGKGLRYTAGRTQCALCGATLFGIPAAAVVRKVVVRVPGHDPVRAIVVDGREIHRCRAFGPPPATTPSPQEDAQEPG